MKIFIYSLSDPITNEVRYIGKTGDLKTRYKAHLSASRKIHTRIGHWIKSLLNQNLQPALSVIEECNKIDWQKREKFWIAYYRKKGINLINHTKGGNEPPQVKRPIKKYSKSKNKYRVRVSFNNKVYYLGTFDTIKKATSIYDAFQKNPIRFLNKIKPKFNRSGVIMFKDGILIKSFPSIIECASYLKTSGSNISRCCRHKAHTHKGYTFQYQPAEG